MRRQPNLAVKRQRNPRLPVTTGGWIWQWTGAGATRWLAWPRASPGGKSTSQMRLSYRRVLADVKQIIPKYMFFQIRSYCLPSCRERAYTTSEASCRSFESARGSGDVDWQWHSQESAQTLLATKPDRYQSGQTVNGRIDWSRRWLTCDRQQSVQTAAERRLETGHSVPAADPDRHQTAQTVDERQWPRVNRRVKWWKCDRYQSVQTAVERRLETGHSVLAAYPDRHQTDETVDGRQRQKVAWSATCMNPDRQQSV